MTRIRRLLVFLLVFSAGLLSLMVMAKSPELSQAKLNHCRVISDRLSRLLCFDEAVNTPVPLSNSLDTMHYPQIWHQVFNAINDSDTSLVWRTEGKNESNAWIAIKSSAPFIEGNKFSYTVMLLSCIDNLSRVELLAPFPIDAPKLSVMLGLPDVQHLRSDGSGVLFSSPRGLPAIDMMKAITSRPFVVLDSGDPNFKGVSFYTQGAKDVIPLLQQRCSW